jgi:hypothetical protein
VRLVVSAASGRRCGEERPSPPRSSGPPGVGARRGHLKLGATPLDGCEETRDAGGSHTFRASTDDAGWLSDITCRWLGLSLGTGKPTSPTPCGVGPAATLISQRQARTLVASAGADRRFLSRKTSVVRGKLSVARRRPAPDYLGCINVGVCRLGGVEAADLDRQTPTSATLLRRAPAVIGRTRHRSFG